jgi:hypothetical protein
VITILFAQNNPSPTPPYHDGFESDRRYILIKFTVGYLNIWTGAAATGRSTGRRIGGFYRQIGGTQLTKTLSTQNYHN